MANPSASHSLVERLHCRFRLWRHEFDLRPEFARELVVTIGGAELLVITKQLRKITEPIGS